jgi:hypothetical protein
MLQQDFSKRIAIVIKKDIESWQVLNAASHIAAYLGNKMGDSFGTGEYFVTKDGKKHSRNSQYPIVIFSAKSGELKKFIEEVRASGLLYIGFFREMIETTDDGEIETIFENKLDQDVEYYGIGIFGENEKVKPLVKKFSLWK